MAEERQSKLAGRPGAIVAHVAPQLDSQRVDSHDSSPEIGQESAPRTYLAATEALISWLTEVEEVLAEKVHITDVSTMEKNVTLYQVRTSISCL